MEETDNWWKIKLKKKKKTTIILTLERLYITILKQKEAAL